MKVMVLLLFGVQVSLPLLSSEWTAAKTDILLVSNYSIIAVQCRYQTTARHDPQLSAHLYPQIHPTASTRASWFVICTAHGQLMAFLNERQILRQQHVKPTLRPFL